MIRFNNDYNHGAYRTVLKALEFTNSESFAGYGEDEWCKKASEKIKKLIGNENADIHFFPGATQANYVICDLSLSSVQSVISADTGHINCHEAASVENTGHKIIALPSKDGKITAEQIAKCAEEYIKSGEAEYLTEPKTVYISFPTEMGTLYSLSELKAISCVCRKYGMYLFVDGARMGYGLSAPQNDVKLTDLAELCDVFYLGGTKCGALFGEAVVVINRDLKRRFKAHMKQNGAVLAKGWLLGLQFHTLLSNGDYFKICEKANLLALKIKDAFVEKGIPLAVDSPTNQQFVILNEEQKAKLSDKYIFEITGETGDSESIVRFCTAWSTSDAEVEALIKDIKELL